MSKEGSLIDSWASDEDAPGAVEVESAILPRPNAQQVAILQDAERREGDTVVVARAGTGKTTTAFASVERFRGARDVAYLAFNARMAEEGKRKQPGGVDVRTWHSLGRGALFKAARQGRLGDPDDQKTRRLIAEAWPSEVEERSPRVGALARASGFAKNTLAARPEEIRQIAERFDLDVGAGKPDGTPEWFERYERYLSRFCDDVISLLDAGVRDWQRRGAYDFDDMVYLPVKLGLTPKQFDRVIADEVQDLNAAQHALLKMARRRGGRVIGYGDDRQAIYGWRGACSDGMRELRAELAAADLRLPVTYRCGKEIVRLARTAVPDYEAAPTNPDGRVEHLTAEVMLRDAAPGDAILSRVNAPLVSHCLALLKQGKRAKIVGRKVGQGLLALLERAQRGGARDVSEFVRWVEDWLAAEVARLEAFDPPREAAIEEAGDSAACLLALTEGASLVSDVRGRLLDLFTEDPEGTIVLSSTHRAKGLEWPTVWMLEGTYRRHQSREEENLWYVAVTRAMSRLVLVSDRRAS
jgi:superfamily I DNA/RNA helicase